MYFNLAFLGLIFAADAVYLDSDCGASVQAQQLAHMIILAEGQQRRDLRCNATLSAAAADKAQDMAEQQFITHYGDGGANRRLLKAGYDLPNEYPRWFSNQVESIAGGNATATDMWQAFMQSTPHRVHLLAEHPFYVHQNEIGVGYVRDKDSWYEHYWVVYIAGNEYRPALVNNERVMPEKHKGALDKQ